MIKAKFKVGDKVTLNRMGGVNWSSTFNKILGINTTIYKTHWNQADTSWYYVPETKSTDGEYYVHESCFDYTQTEWD